MDRTFRNTDTEGGVTGVSTLVRGIVGGSTDQAGLVGAHKNLVSVWVGVKVLVIPVLWIRAGTGRAPTEKKRAKRMQ